MNTSQRFSVSIHILTLLAASDSALTSEYIASSVDTHPVVIRRVMAHLRQHGLVESRPGASGGWRLLRGPRKINLSEVYQIASHAELLSMHSHPNKDCPIGGHIQVALKGVFANAQIALEKSLGTVTIADVLADVRERAG
jgi:Rrf2 family protein